MSVVEVRCDLCEWGTDLVWVYKLHEFGVGLAEDKGDAGLLLLAETGTAWPEGDEWAVCSACQAGIKADYQHPILRRRVNALIRDTPEWRTLSDAERGLVQQTIEVMVMAAISSIDKEAPGRAWTEDDQAQALAAVLRAGRRL